MSSDLQVVDKSLRSVFVGNIPYEATEEKLKEIFSQVGPVLSFKLVYDRETGKPKGYGFCEYRDQETALSAMRNLNGFEISGRTLRVDNACTEKSRLELQNLMSGPVNEGPYGNDIEPEKAPEAISKAVASLPPEQMFELMKQMKLCIQNNPSEARTMLLQNPQLAYALLQAQVVMRIVDPQTAMTMLHRTNKPQAPILPADGMNFHPLPTNVKSEFNGSPATREFATNRSESYPTVVPPVPMSQEFIPAAVVPDPFISKREEELAMPTTKIGLLGDRPPGVLTRPQMPAGATPFSGRQDLDLRQMDPRLQSGDLDLRVMGSKTAASRVNSHDSFDRDPRLRDPRMDNEFRDTTRQSFERPAYEQRDPRLGNLAGNVRPVPAPDQEKAALIMQVLQLSDDQIAMLPADQRQSIMVLKEQIARSAAQPR